MVCTTKSPTPGNGQVVTMYYTSTVLSVGMAGTTRIAMRKYQILQPMTVEYLLSDHLRSTSLTMDVNGAKILELRYRVASRAALWRVDKACPLRYTAGVLREGEIRATWTASPSTTPAYKMPLYTYTGQAAYLDDPLTSGVTEGFGLMFYNARWYDPYLNHFVQADTIVPGGVQGLDRYAYVNNSPLNYVDPSGHFGQCRDDWSGGKCRSAQQKWGQFERQWASGGNTSCSGVRYCNLNNGARLDWSHFKEGVKDWYFVLDRWDNGSGKYKMAKVTNEFDGESFDDPIAKFSLEGIKDVGELRSKFLEWYAKTYQPAFEAWQATVSLKGVASSYNTEDIPSMVIGAAMASAFDNEVATETLYNIAIWQLGGGIGTDDSDYSGPKNITWYLMTHDGTLLLYPSNSEGRFNPFGILNDL